MHKQRILDIEKNYPFGKFLKPPPNTKIFVRKIIKYNQSSQNSVKKKLSIVKKFNNIDIIKIVKIIEEENKFQLLYEYIPYKIQNSEKFLIDTEDIHKKLFYLASILYLNNVQTKFELENLGYNQKNELKYYLDLNFTIIQNSNSNLINRYFSQINKIIQELKQIRLEKRVKIFKNKKQKSNRFFSVNNQQKNYEKILFQQSSQFQSKINQKQDIDINTYGNENHNIINSILRKSKEKPIAPVKSNQQKLNALETKLQQLCLKIKNNADRRSASKDRFKQKSKSNDRKFVQIQDELNIRESVIQIKQKKLDSRKNSGNPLQLKSFAGRRPQSPKYRDLVKSTASLLTYKQSYNNKSLQKIFESDEFFNNKKQKIQGKFQTHKMVSNLSISQNKTSQQDLKKTSLSNMSTSKYFDQFCEVLGHYEYQKDYQNIIDISSSLKINPKFQSSNDLNLKFDKQPNFSQKKHKKNRYDIYEEQQDSQSISLQKQKEQLKDETGFNNRISITTSIKQIQNKQC